MRNTISKPGFLLLSGVFTLLFMSILYTSMAKVLPSGAPGVFSLQTAFSKARLVSILSAWGPALGTYLALMAVDFFYALSYGLFLSGLIEILTRKSRKLSFLFYLPLGAATLDWVENVLHLIFLPDYETISSSMVFFVSLLSSIKWGLAIISILAIILLLIRALIDLGKAES